MRLVATIPNARIALARMLAEHGHTLVGAEDDARCAVWVVDLPDAGPLPSVLTATDAAGLVVLCADPAVCQRLARARSAGWAFLPRAVDAEDLDLAVRSAAAGHVLLDQSALAALSSVSPPVSPCDTPYLTPREMQVLLLIADGLPNKGIARRLGVSENTVKFHVASLCARLDARSRAEAVALAARQGLLSF